MLNATLNLYKNAYSGLTKNIWLLSIVMLINRSGTMVIGFLILYCMEQGYTAGQGGWAVAIYGLGSIAGALIGGKLSDVLGFYKVQFGALFFGGILFILLGQMETYNSLRICAFVLGMVNEAFRPANATAIAHYSNKKNRTRSFSLVRLAINIGWAVGMAVGGFLASIDYHLLFWVDGCTNIFAAITLLFILPRVSLEQQKKPQEAVIAAANAGTDNKPVTKDTDFMVFLFFVLLFGTCFFQIFTSVLVYMEKELSLNESLIGIIMAINGIIIALFEMLIVNKLEGKRPYLYLIALGTVLMAVAFLFLNLPLASGFAVAVIAVLILTISEMVAMPFMNSYYISRSTEKKRGQYAGFYTMAWSAAQVIGSSGGVLLAQKTGFLHFWWVVACICLVAAAGFYGLLLKRTKLI